MNEGWIIDEKLGVELDDGSNFIETFELFVPVFGLDFSLNDFELFFNVFQRNKFFFFQVFLLFVIDIDLQLPC